jgi:hypothetical protein
MLVLFLWLWRYGYPTETSVLYLNTHLGQGLGKLKEKWWEGGAVIGPSPLHTNRVTQQQVTMCVSSMFPTGVLDIWDNKKSLIYISNMNFIWGHWNTIFLPLHKQAYAQHQCATKGKGLRINVDLGAHYGGLSRTWFELKSLGLTKDSKKAMKGGHHTDDLVPKEFLKAKFWGPCRAQ